MKVNCSYCNKELKRAPWQIKRCVNLFCDRSCKSKWWSENVTKQNHPNYNSVIVGCSYCNKPLKVTAGINKKIKNHFCNNKCKGKWNSINHVGEKSPRWKGGTVLKNRRRDSKRLSTPYGKINNRPKSGIYTSLNKNKNGMSWESLVGYICADLKKHLEKLFIDGMSWDNMGEWHIDHKIPKSAFNYNTHEDEDFKRCWALNNLQPLWAKDNLIKNNKIL